MGKGITIHPDRTGFRVEPHLLMKCPRCGQTGTKFKVFMYCPHCDKNYVYNDTVKKEYPEIIDRLEEFAWDKYEVRVITLEINWFGVTFEGCVFDVPSGAVFLKSNMSDQERIVLLAHEIGHAIDLYENYNGDVERYRAENVLQKEQMAWDHAERLLCDFGFTEWERFYDHKSEGLNSYVEGLRKESL